MSLYICLRLRISWTVDALLVSLLHSVSRMVSILFVSDSGVHLNAFTGTSVRSTCSLARPTIIYGYSTNKIRRCFAHSFSLSSLLFQAGGIIVRISWISKDVVFIRNSHFAFGDIVVLRYDDDDRYTSVDGVVVASSSCAFIAFYLALRTKRSSSRWWFIHRNKIEIMSQQP